MRVSKVIELLQREMKEKGDVQVILFTPEKTITQDFKVESSTLNIWIQP